MKLIIVFLTLIGTSHAEVIDLGTLDSRAQLLDQRFTQSYSEQDRLMSLGTFYKDRELDLFKDVQAQDQILLHHPEAEWEKLFEGHL